MKEFEVTYRLVCKKRVQAETGTAAHAAASAGLQSTIGRAGIVAVEIQSVIDTEHDDSPCAECEAIRVRSEDPENPLPDPKPPGGSPTGGTFPTLLQEAA